MILIQGFRSSLQIIFLKLILGNSCSIIVQHHSEHPVGKKILLQKIADWFIAAYIFTTLDHAKEWVNKKVIRSINKCHEVFEVSTPLISADKDESKEKTTLRGNHNFLSVGRLDNNKDPVTILRGFEKYLNINADARLYFIFQTEDLLSEIKKIIAESDILTTAVYLIGKVPNEELRYWYSAADFFVSASHYESTGLSLMESMACECIPIVTDIPAFEKVLKKGTYGITYAVGNPDDLFTAFKSLSTINRQKITQDIRSYFESELSFKAIADRIYHLSMQLKAK